MSETRDAILLAAHGLFHARGVRNTTMSDIAEAAGVTRQTVYNTWKNRDEVLRAVVRHFAEAGARAMEAGWAEAATLGDKVDVFYAHGPLAWWDMLVETPNSADLLEGINETAAEEMAAADARLVGAIAGLLEPHADRLAGLGLTPEGYADFLYSAGKAAKYDSDSREQLVARLEALKASALALLGET